MKCLRQVLRVLWTAKRTNEWALETAELSRSLLASVKEMKLAYYGHIVQGGATDVHGSNRPCPLYISEMLAPVSSTYMRWQLRSPAAVTTQYQELGPSSAIELFQ